MGNTYRYVLTPDEVADRLRIPVRTLEEWRLKRKGPPYFRAGRHLRYSVYDLEAWILEQTRPAGIKRLPRSEPAGRTGLDR